MELEHFERLEKLSNELKELTESFIHTIERQYDGLTAQKQRIFSLELLKVQQELTSLTEDI